MPLCSIIMVPIGNDSIFPNLKLLLNDTLALAGRIKLAPSKAKHSKLRCLPPMITKSKLASNDLHEVYHELRSWHDTFPYLDCWRASNNKAREVPLRFVHTLRPANNGQRANQSEYLDKQGMVC